MIQCSSLKALEPKAAVYSPATLWSAGRCLASFVSLVCALFFANDALAQERAVSAPKVNAAITTPQAVAILPGREGGTPQDQGNEAHAAPQHEGSTDVHGTAESTAESTWTGQLYNNARESIVLVRAGESEGTGFVFLNNRIIATAFHVIEGAVFPEVVFANGEEVTAKVIAWDEDWDLAILQLPTPTKAPPLHVVSDGQVSVGDLVATIGNPWGAEQRKLPNSTAPVWALSHGIISAPPGDLIQTDAPVNPGNSGGPLLTTTGRVVGVLVVRVEGSDGISFAVGAKHLIELASRIGQQPAYEVAAWHFDPEVYWLPLGEYSLSGVSLGLRVVHASGLGVAVRGGRLWGSRVVESVLVHQGRNRWLGEAELRYYLADAPSFSLAFGAGVALSWDAVKTYRTTIDDASQLTEQTRRESRNMIRGLFGVSIDTDIVSLHAGVYALGGDTGGRLGIGFVF